MIPLADKENKSYEKQEVCHICKEEFCIDENEKSECKLYHQVRDHCHYIRRFIGAAHSICNLRYKVPKEIPIVPHNVGYDHHFISKQLAEEFKGEFECIGQNDEKYITFSVPIKKEHNNGKTARYKLKFISSFRLCQPYYQILLIMYLIGFINISANIVNLNLAISLSKIIS